MTPRPKLLNYTTKVAAATTAEQVQVILRLHGAKEIRTRFDDEGEISMLAWSMHLHHPETKADLGEVPFELPIDVDAVLKVLQKTAPPRYANRPQASRVAWRILKDWVEAQMALVDTQMVDFAEVFLAYTHMGDKTLYDHMLDGGFQSMQALTSGKK